MNSRIFTRAALVLAPMACGSAPTAPSPPVASRAPEAASAAGPEAPGNVDAAAPAGEPAAERRGGRALPVPPGTPSSEVSASLLRALSKTEGGNVFVSGASLRGALGMTALGARGQTLDEMVRALGVDPEPAKNAAAARAEREGWATAAGNSELSIANRLWVATGYPVEKSFVDAAQAGYGAGAAQVDFAKAPEQSRQRINAWVSEATKGKISDLLPTDAIQASTRLVLTNAVYFKGTWLHPFDKAQTAPAPFHGAAGDVTVPMMQERENLSYGEDGDIKLVELPYRDSSLTMLVALPPAGQVDAVAGTLTGARIEGWGRALQPRKVVLSMPRFTFSWGRSISPELQAMGIRTAFRDGDFTGIAAPQGEPPLVLSGVFHKTFVVVDEIGTEAAAATGAHLGLHAYAIPVEVKLDRPFLFFVRNSKTGDVLFAGRFSKP